MLIDTHVHYNLEPLLSEWQTQWQDAQNRGVGAAMVVGTSIETTEAALRLCEQEPRFRATVGVHPHVWQDWMVEGATDVELEERLSEMEQKLREWVHHPATKAIGETGLDLFWLSEAAPELHTRIQIWQEKSFRVHLAVASAQALPLVLHMRDRGDGAYFKVLEILEAEETLPTLILHCVSGPAEYVQRALKLGAYVSVAGNVTYPSADHIRELVRLTPPDRLLLETDAPYLPPVPFRGQPCRPSMIADTAEFLQKNLQIDVSRCAENAQTCFNDYAWFGAQPRP
jgi:TatD DNase family protein